MDLVSGFLERHGRAVNSLKSLIGHRLGACWDVLDQIYNSKSNA
jgi:hypothetical protein